MADVGAEHEANETTRLLDPSTSPGDEGLGPWRIVLIAAGVSLILNASANIAFVPTTTILQDIICDKYYARAHIENPMAVRGCTVGPVQSEVAFINGWKESFDTLPSILVAVPWGAVADRIGRKFVLLLAILGCFLNDAWLRLVFWFPHVFPLRTVWLGGLWQLVGGGAVTMSSVTWVLVADACPSDQRTVAFSVVTAASILSQLAFVPIGGVLADHIDPWLPMWISSGAMILAWCIAFAVVPETLPEDKRNGAGELAALLGQGDNGAKRSLLAHIEGYLASAVAVCRWAAGNPRIVLVLFCFFLFHFGEQSGGTLFLQYAQKRLGWTLGKASYLYTIGPATNLFVLMALIPAASKVMQRRGALHTAAKDKLMAQTSSVFLVLGFAGIFLARSWTAIAVGWLVASLGLPFSVPVRSLVTGMVDQTHLGAVFSAAAVLTYGGLLAGGPVFAEAFKWGMGLGEFWVGMPFLIAAACFVLALVFVSTATPRSEGDGETASGGAGVD